MTQPGFSSRLGRVVATGLSGAQRHWHAVAFVVLALLCADTLFLLAHRGFGQLDVWIGWGRVPSRFYQAATLFHSAAGYLLALLLLGFVGLHLPAVVRCIGGRWLLVLTGLFTAGAYGFLLYSGNYFLLNAKSADKELLYLGHMVVGSAFVVVYIVHRSFAVGHFPKRRAGGLLATACALAAIMIAVELAGLFLSATGPAKGHAPLPSIADASGFTPATKLNPAAPFFPSPVALASGASQIDTSSIIGPSEPGLAAQVRAEVERDGFAHSRPIGAEDCARCHADTVAQWQGSAHRFSSFNNPFYVASLKALRENDSEPNEFIKQHLEGYGFKNVRTGQIKSQWCAACHDPALLFEGKMRQEIDQGEVKAQAGLTCMACHQIKDIPGHTGSGNYVWDDEFKDPYLFTASTDPLATQIHDLYLKANPEQHKRDMLKPVFKEPTFCSTCHKVSLEPQLNEYHYLRGQDEYDAWHDSGVALNAARTFYQPKQARVCQTCHMPEEPAPLGDVAAKNGKVKSHRFLAANTALPLLRGDQDTIQRTEAFLRASKLRISFAGLRAGARLGLTTEEPQASLEVRAGEAAELNVVVRNLNVGHAFPSGTNDSNQGWIEISVQDEKGRPLLQAGRVDEQGRVVENTRVYNAVFIDRFSNRVARRNAQDIAAPVYIAVIPPGTADLSRFRIPLEAIPPDVRQVKVKARVLWRKFNRDYLEFARASEPKAFSRSGAELPITEIAAASGDMTVERTERGTTFTLRAESPVPVAERHLLTHDYGIGLLLQGDTVVARKVLESLVVREPECANCRRTLARLYVTEGDYAAARATLLDHERRWPGDAQAAWLWAGVLRGEGDDEAAIKALHRVIEVYPRDREAWRLLSEINYRSGHFQAAADAAARVLAIDPEDATAHYYAMLAKRSLGDVEGSRLEQAAYRYYQRDESAQRMTLDFRQRDPASNFAAQAIRVYELQ